MIPQVDLSTLSGPELRQLLDATRRRGQADLSYQILQEMAARREGAARPKAGARKAKRGEPRLVALNLGDPMERSDEPTPLPHWNLPPQDDNGGDVEDRAELEPEAQAEPDFEAEAPLVMTSAFQSPPRERAPGRPPRRGDWLLVGLVIGLVLGGGLGWALSGALGDPRSSPWAVAAKAAAPAALPALPPAAPTAPEPAQSQTALNAIPQPPPPIDTPPATVAEPAKPPPEPVEVAQAEPAPAPLSEEVHAAPACSKATAADRAICDSPHLQQLQTELRQAYAEALQVHQDRSTLRQRQLAWRDGRNDVADPERLARLYEARIRTLKSATEDALRQQ